MATANPFEAEITCPVFFDIFEDPQILRDCFHTLCMKCVKQLENGGQVQCPECRQFTRMTHVKKDFKTQRLIDLHKAEQTQPIRPHQLHQKCGLCEISAVPITHHCSECEDFICSGCAKVHEKSKAFESHNVKFIPTMIKSFEFRLQTTIGELEGQLKNIYKELVKISITQTDVQSSNTKQIQDVRKFTQDGIDSLNRNKERLENIVNKANNNLLHHLNQREEMLKHEKKDLQSKVKLLKDMIKSQDIQTLQETADNINDTITESIRQIKEKLQEMKTDFRSPVTVKKGKNIDIEGYVQITMLDAKLDDEHQIQPVFQGFCSQLWTKTFRKSLEITLDFPPQRIHMKDDQLYCAISALPAIHVYDKYSNLVKRIQNDKIKKLWSFTFLENGDIIVAGKDGLFKLDQSGQNCTKISDGQFADVDCYDGDLYALDYEQCSVSVLRNENHTTAIWCKVKQFKLKYSNCHNYDRIQVCAGTICISSRNNNFILQYDLQGNLRHEVGNKGSGDIQFKSPYICGIDEDKNMLVADGGNHRLQVCIAGQQSQWHEVSLSDQVDWPVDAVVSKDYKEIWIIKHHGFALMKFIVN